MHCQYIATMIWIEMIQFHLVCYWTICIMTELNVIHMISKILVNIYQNIWIILLVSTMPLHLIPCSWTIAWCKQHFTAVTWWIANTTHLCRGEFRLWSAINITSVCCLLAPYFCLMKVSYSLWNGLILFHFILRESSLVPANSHY